MKQKFGSDSVTNEKILVADVFVYGGTVGGIAAAIAAARRGCGTILIERGNHIGGMTASGLGSIDLLHANSVGGIFQEFIQGTHEHYTQTYGEDSEQYRLTWGGLFMEPSVAEQVLDRMVANEENLKIIKRFELVEVLKQADRVIGARLRNLDTGECVRVECKVAIDGTYEGDFAAAAAVKYRIGRESRTEHGERFAGVIFFDWRYNRQEIHPKSTGEASEYIQAYCFRETLSDDASRIPIERPENYKEFLSVYRRLLKDLENGRVRKMRDVIWIDPIPNHKWCTNGHIEALTSLDIAEWNKNWPDANYETRDEIFDRFRQFSQGLWYYLQNDPAMPRGLQTEAQCFGLCPDEYPENNHYPWQLYVREARRIVGEYTITEHDSVPQPGQNRPTPHPDTIAVYGHSFDSHQCRFCGQGGSVFTDDGFELAEGTIWFRNKLRSVNRPADLPYGAILPEKIDGLLVPLALSATHVAYSAVRMEPTFMAVGQAAGIAAALAIETRREPRRVDVGDLQSKLVRQGQVLVYFSDLQLDDPDFEQVQLAAIGKELKDFKVSSLRRVDI